MPEKGFTKDAEVRCVQALVTFLGDLKRTKGVQIDAVNQSVLAYMVRSCYEFEIDPEGEVLIMAWFNEYGERCELNLGRKSSLTDKYWVKNAAAAKINIESINENGIGIHKKLYYGITDVKKVKMIEFEPILASDPTPRLSFVINGEEGVTSDRSKGIEEKKPFSRFLMISSPDHKDATPMISIRDENFYYSTIISPRR